MEVMKNIRGLADKVMKTHLKNLDGKVDCYGHSQLISLLNRQAKSVGKNQIEVDKNSGIVSYPYKRDKLDDCRYQTQTYGFGIDVLRMPSEIPFYFEKLNLILPRDGGMHRLTTLWEFSKINSYTVVVEKMELPEYFFEIMVINKKNKTANGLRLCDVEVDFVLALQKNDQRLRIKKNIIDWIKSKFMKFV
jgi:hypothetical protein